MQRCYEGSVRKKLLDWGGRQNAAFLEEVTQARARFLIIGGTAVNYYVPSRRAHDLDLLLDRDGRTPGAVAQVISRRGHLLSGDFADWCREPTSRFQFLCLKDDTLNLDLGRPPDDFDFRFHWSAADVKPFPGSRNRCRVASVQTLLECLKHSPHRKHAKDRKLLRALLAPAPKASG